ncbi:F-box/LRR-repeat protein 5-like [Lineus longissimus]|uniref:F-box/LRR-repeat protein 5-like n=1 Tax=Lineus longissimus TaxID=88925 RepID=UPI00315D6D44
MAPYPEELDVFTVPHSRMKELIHKYCDMLSHTNFSSGHEFGNLLQNLHNTFSEFKNHEAIENRYIMTQLRNKLDALSIQNTAVCNCHKDNRLTEMMNMFRDGYYWMDDKTMRERLNYGIQLKEALEDFTKDFVPHMKEEEEVFQPLLMKYFSYEELQNLREKVINEHTRKQNEKKYVWDEKEEVDEDYESEKSSEKEEVQEKTSVLDLPPEITMNIFSHLSPKDLCRCAQVCSAWSEVAMDGKLWQEVSPVRWAQGDWRFHVEDEEDDDDDDSNAAFDEDEETRYVCLDEDRDIDESESSDEYSESENGNIYLLKRESKMLHSLARYILPRVGWGVEKLNLANSKALTNALLYKMLSHCPNIEHLLLTQTTISDSAFKGLFKHATCTNLKTLVLSGCANITDVTLIRFANATTRNIESENMLLDEDNTGSEDTGKNDEVVQDGHKEFWTFPEVDDDALGSGSEDSGVVFEVGTEIEDVASHEDANCCRFGCGCRVGLSLGTRLKFDKTVGVDMAESGGVVDIGTEILREISQVPLLCDSGVNPGGTREYPEFPVKRPFIPDAESKPPDWPLLDLEECASTFVRQKDGGLRRTSNCNDPRCFKFEGMVGTTEDEKWIKITMEDAYVENAPQNVAGDRDKGNLTFEIPDAIFVHNHYEIPNGNGVDEYGSSPGAMAAPGADVLGGPGAMAAPGADVLGGPGAMAAPGADVLGGPGAMAAPGADVLGGPGTMAAPGADVLGGPGAMAAPGTDVLGGQPPDNCDDMRGASNKDSSRGKVVICPKDGAACDVVNSEDAVFVEAKNPGDFPLSVSVATDGICCKVLEELQAPQYAAKRRTAPAGGHVDIQESVAAQLHEPGTQRDPHGHNNAYPNDVQNHVTTGPRLLKPARLFSDEKLKRTFEQDPINTDLSFGFEILMARTPRMLEHLNLSGCFRITDVGLRSLGEDSGLPNLRYLDLSGCSNVSAAGLTDLIQQCPLLEHDKFYYCDNITDGPLASLANGCQNLACAKRVCCRSGFYLNN